MAKNKKQSFFGYNFWTVFWFEVSRALKKKSFWLSILIAPAMMIVLGGIFYLSNLSSKQSEENLAKSKFTALVTDKSGLIDQKLASRVGFKLVDIKDKDKAVEDVRLGKVDAYYFIPENIGKNKVSIYAKDAGAFDNSKYEGSIKSVLQLSASSHLSANEVTILVNKGLRFDTTTYKDGKKFDAFNQMAIPATFLVLFVFIVPMFSSQMISSTTEEKENRVTEIILTSVKPMSLIRGKIFAFLALMLIQTLSMIVLGFAAYLIAKYTVNLNFNLPAIDFMALDINPARILIAVAGFILSTLLLISISCAIGVMAPTAKEASQFASWPMLLIFIPFYAIGVIVAQPESWTSLGMIFFPLTAPIPLLLLNALGSVSYLNAIISLMSMSIAVVIMFALAAKAFGLGIVNYKNALWSFKRK